MRWRASLRSPPLQPPRVIFPRARAHAAQSPLRPRGEKRPADASLPATPAAATMEKRIAPALEGSQTARVHQTDRPFVCSQPAFPKHVIRPAFRNAQNACRALRRPWRRVRTSSAQLLQS